MQGFFGITYFIISFATLFCTYKDYSYFGSRLEETNKEKQASQGRKLY